MSLVVSPVDMAMIAKRWSGCNEQAVYARPVDILYKIDALFALWQVSVAAISTLNTVKLQINDGNVESAVLAASQSSMSQRPPAPMRCR